MNTKHTYRCAAAVAWSLLCALAGFAAADERVADTQAVYNRMARLDEYLIPDLHAEIALARSAAPAAISDKATLLALKPQGYETVANGSNGFTCLVERSWMSPFDRPEFWNPKIRGPVCYNPAASKSILAYTLQRTKLALAGLSKAQMFDEIRAAAARRQVPWPAPGAMSFMMSKDGYLGDGQGHWHSHLMIYVPTAEGASWGANLPDSPVLLDDAHRKIPEPATTFLVPVAHWSDGSEAPIR
jgi:hypothetical protein